MQELLFVIKSLLFTCLIVFAMQFKVGDTTLESRANTFITNSSFSLFLQQSAHGAVKGLKQLKAYTSEKINGMMSGK